MMNEVERERLSGMACQALQHGTANLRFFPDLLKKVIRERCWERRKIYGIGIIKLPSLRDLITRPELEGWGEDPAKIEAVIRDDPETLALWEAEMRGKPGPKPKGSEGNSVDNVNRTASKGNSRAYTVSRLKRERPDLFAQVNAGTLSANAAAIKAGWRKKPSALEIALSAALRLTAEDRRTLIARLTEARP